MPKSQTNEIRERQHARHQAQYSAYQDGLHAEVNKARRLVHHLRGHAGDPCALAALEALPMAALARVPQALEFLRAAGRA